MSENQLVIFVKIIDGTVGIECKSVIRRCKLSFEFNHFKYVVHKDLDPTLWVPNALREAEIYYDCKLHIDPYRMLPNDLKYDKINNTLVMYAWVNQQNVEYRFPLLMVNK